MKILSESQFEKMARGAANDFIQNSIPLATSAVKVAREMGLNPDQIKSLVQLANVMTHTTLFDKKTDADRSVEFQPADPDAVLNEVYQKEPESTSPELDSGDSALDFTGDFPDLACPGESIEPTITTPEIPEATTSPGDKQLIIIKIRKIAEVLNNKRWDTVELYREKLDKVTSELRHADHAEFEKDALCIHGQHIIPVLNDIRRHLGVDLMEKTAALSPAKRVVDADVPAIQFIADLSKLSHQYDDYAATLNMLKERLGDQV